MNDYTRYLRIPEVIAQPLADGGTIPNNPRLPLLHYRAATELPEDDPAALFETLFEHNQWVGSWRNGIFGFHHFHSTAHEALGIYSGTATVQLGGDSGVTVAIAPGDVVVIPAGVGHKQLESSRDLGVVGAYPAGQSPDLCRGIGGGKAKHRESIAATTMPASDPLYGPDGPIFEHWR